MKKISDTEKKIMKFRKNNSAKKPCEICGKMLNIEEATCPFVCSPKNRVCSEMLFCCKSHTFEEHVALVKQRRKINILGVSMKKLIEKSTKEKFDNEEITAYISMALDELCSMSNSINEWVKYRVLSLAHTAIGINEKKAQRRALFLRKAEIFRNKMPRLKIMENRQTAANSHSPKQRKSAKD